MLARAYADQTAAINTMNKAADQRYRSKHKDMERSIQEQNLLLVS